MQLCTEKSLHFSRPVIVITSWLLVSPGLVLDTRAIHHECLLVFQVSYDVSYDTGDKSIQCGRLNDVLKLWLMWKQKVGGSS